MTGEGGSTTTNLQQGLAKVFSHFNPSTNTERDSFNQSSRSDEGTGFSQLNFTNNMNSTNYSSHLQGGQTTAPTTGTGGYVASTYAHATTHVELVYGYGNTWVFFDYNSQKLTVHGDLA